MNPTTDRLPTPSSPLPSATASVPSARKHPFHPDPASGRAAFFLCSTCLLVASAPREAQPYARCEDLRQQLVHHTHRQQPVSRLAARYEEECGRSWPERAGLRPRWTGSGRSSSTTLCAVWEKQLSTLGHLGIRAPALERHHQTWCREGGPQPAAKPPPRVPEGPLVFASEHAEAQARSRLARIIEAETGIGRARRSAAMDLECVAIGWVARNRLALGFGATMRDVTAGGRTPGDPTKCIWNRWKRNVDLVEPSARAQECADKVIDGGAGDPTRGEGEVIGALNFLHPKGLKKDGRGLPSYPKWATPEREVRVPGLSRSRIRFYRPPLRRRRAP